MRKHISSITFVVFAALLCLCVSVAPSAPAAPSSASLDFDLLVKQAPVLDMDAPSFDEIKAEVWHRETANLYQTTFAEAPSEFRLAIMSAVLDTANKPSDNKEKFVKDQLASLQRIPSKGKEQTFLKRFIIEYDKDNLATFHGLYCIEYALTIVGMTDSAGKASLADLTREFKSRMHSVPVAKRKATVEKVRAQIKKVRLTTYKPTPGPQDILDRKHVCKMLTDLAEMIEDTMKLGG
jgi:hypothetical protein